MSLFGADLCYIFLLFSLYKSVLCVRITCISLCVAVFRILVEENVIRPLQPVSLLSTPQAV